MWRKRISVVWLMLWPAGWAAADGEQGPRAGLVSPDALAVVDVAKPRVLLDQLFAPQVAAAVEASPQFRQWREKPDFLHVQATIDYFERRHDASWQQLAGKLLGGGMTLALGPKDAALLIIDTEDEKLLKDVHEFLVLVTRTQAQGQGRPDPVKSAEYRGITGWSLGPQEAHALLGKRLLVTNKPELLRQAADLQADPQAATLAKLPGYQAAMAGGGPQTVATLFARTDVLRQLPGANRVFRQDDNPLAALLLAPVMTMLEQSTWAALRLSLDGQTLRADLATDVTRDKSPEKLRFALPAEADQGALPPLSVPRQIASLSFYRDLHQFYSAKDQLFPERTSGLIFFENMMGIFFTGRELTDEILAEAAPEIRFVVAGQHYDPAVGTPVTKLPGFAVVLKLKNPEKFHPIAEEAFQKALGLINFTRGQEAQPGLILDRPTYADVKYSVAAFSSAGEADKQALDIRFNFQPALAMPADYLVFSSCDSLARDLIEALKKEAAGGARPVPGLHSAIDVQGSELSAILRANLEAMIRQNMVEKGNTRQQAESELGLLLEIVRRVEQLKLTGSSQAGATLSLEAKLNLEGLR